MQALAFLVGLSATVTGFVNLRADIMADRVGWWTALSCVFVVVGMYVLLDAATYAITHNRDRS